MQKKYYQENLLGLSFSSFSVTFLFRQTINEILRPWREKSDGEGLKRDPEEQFNQNQLYFNLLQRTYGDGHSASSSHCLPGGPHVGILLSSILNLSCCILLLCLLFPLQTNAEICLLLSFLQWVLCLESSTTNAARSPACPSSARLLLPGAPRSLPHPSCAVCWEQGLLPLPYTSHSPP